MKTPKFKTFILFGETNVQIYERKFEHGKRLDIYQKEELKNGAIRKSFNTQAELNAYLEGIYDANGWLGNIVITEKEYKTINKFKTTTA